MSNPEHNQVASGYEKRDTNIKAIVWIGVISVVVLIVMVIALFNFFTSTREEVYQQQVLQAVSRDLMELRRVEDSVLTTYELLDSETRKYRIPVQRAMELLVAESAGTSVTQ